MILNEGSNLVEEINVVVFIAWGFKVKNKIPRSTIGTSNYQMFVVEQKQA